MYRKSSPALDAYLLLAVTIGTDSLKTAVKEHRIFRQATQLDQGMRLHTVESRVMVSPFLDRCKPW
jgi:hypothetical protein